MTTVRTPRSTAAAQALLEQFAIVDVAIAKNEAWRNGEIATVNMVADTDAAPLLAERAAILAALQPWWAKAATALTLGACKSIELGGCMIGSRAGRQSLVVCGDEKGIVAALLKLDWATALLNVKVSLDKRAVLKALDGEHGKQLVKLGLGVEAGEEAFFVERVKQGGVVSEMAA